MTPTYRLPDNLGGWPVEMPEPHNDVLRFVDVEIVDGPYKGIRMTMPRAALIAVPPPLPPEPAGMGEAVRVTVDDAYALLFAQNDPGRWTDTRSGSSVTWSQLHDIGTVTRLVPDPLADAPALPWSANTDLGTPITIENHEESGCVVLRTPLHAGLAFSAQTARAAGLAFLRASDEVRQ